MRTSRPLKHATQLEPSGRTGCERVAHSRTPRSSSQARGLDAHSSLTRLRRATRPNESPSQPRHAAAAARPAGEHVLARGQCVFGAVATVCCSAHPGAAEPQTSTAVPGERNCATAVPSAADSAPSWVSRCAVAAASAASGPRCAAVTPSGTRRFRGPRRRSRRGDGTSRVVVRSTRRRRAHRAGPVRGLARRRVDRAAACRLVPAGRGGDGRGSAAHHHDGCRGGERRRPCARGWHRRGHRLPDHPVGSHRVERNPGRAQFAA
jgi:hypothetical protein